MPLNCNERKQEKPSELYISKIGIYIYIHTLYRLPHFYAHFIKLSVNRITFHVINFTSLGLYLNNRITYA